METSEGKSSSTRNLGIVMHRSRTRSHCRTITNSPTSAVATMASPAGMRPSHCGVSAATESSEMTERIVVESRSESATERR